MTTAILVGIVIVLAIVAGSLVLGVVGSLIGWLIVGLVAGFLATAIMKSRGSDIVSNLVLGLVGSLVSGFLLNFFRLGWLDNNIIGSIIFSTLGAMLLIGLGRIFTSSKSSYPPSRY